MSRRLSRITKTLAAAFVSVLVTITLSASPAAASSLGFQLDPGDRLLPGRIISSENGLYQLKMTDSGNMVLRYNDGKIIGDTATYGHPGTVAFMQRDGNFVLRAPGNVPIWESRTAGHPGTVIQIQNDGAVVLYAPRHIAIAVMFPTNTFGYSVPTPRFGGNVTASLAPGVNQPSEVGVAVWDGTRVVGCATAGKLVDLAGGNAAISITEEQACGMVTEGKAPEVDSYSAVRLTGSVAFNLVKWGGRLNPIGAGLGAAWEILSETSPAY